MATAALSKSSAKKKRSSGMALIGIKHGI